MTSIRPRPPGPKRPGGIGVIPGGTPRPVQPTGLPPPMQVGSARGRGAAFGTQVSSARGRGAAFGTAGGRHIDVGDIGFPGVPDHGAGTGFTGFDRVDAIKRSLRGSKTFQAAEIARGYRKLKG